MLADVLNHHWRHIYSRDTGNGDTSCSASSNDRSVIPGMVILVQRQYKQLWWYSYATSGIGKVGSRLNHQFNGATSCGCPTDTNSSGCGESVADTVGNLPTMCLVGDDILFIFGRFCFVSNTDLNPEPPYEPLGFIK